MNNYYTAEKNVQIILSLLKFHNIRRVVASPGATNVTLIGSMQRDSYFQVYSSVDERSAAYIACGLAAETGEPVVISCTGATASRNYFPGLTEAYYRKLPVLAITSTQAYSKVGHHVAQVVDRSIKPKDAVRMSVFLPIVKDADDLWDCEIKVNKAILELKRHGGGPVHINLPTTYNRTFDVKELPKARVIERITPWDTFPELKGRVAVFIGAHKPFTIEETQALDDFCAANDAVVFCDHTSGYKGKYRVQYALAAGQHMSSVTAPHRADIFIHIGEITGDYETLKISGAQVWRVNQDGEIRDTFRKLRYVFEMPEHSFFRHYAENASEARTDYLQSCRKLLDTLRERIPEVPFSNIWLASRMASLIPSGSTLHFGILNSLRSWNFYELPESVTTACNTGGFGIDGGLSTLVGASLANRNKLYYCVIGDLAFFYDMNVAGNRHVGANLRILLVNNGKGTEFRNYGHHATLLGEEANQFIAAAGHFGNKSRTLVKHYAEDLGYEYLTASSKEEFEHVYERFLIPEITDKPMLFEVFTDSNEESRALELMMKVDVETKHAIKEKAKNIIRETLGTQTIATIKKILK